MKHIASYFKRFRREERGTATIEFVILFPFFVTMFCAAVELGMITFRHSMLERGLDMAVRDVRLTTGANYQHDEIRDRTCAYAGFLPDCSDNLRLEMLPINMRNYAAPSDKANCIDESVQSNPIRQFSNGQQNQTMMLRACFVFKPVFPLTGLGRHLTTDGAGNAAMVATSAFVQEPL